MTENDIRRFAQYGVSISHNPAPNLYLGSGIPSIPESLRDGVNAERGTDGAASNNSTDMLETMKLAALIQKGIHRDASVITADQVIRMATCGGAKALQVYGLQGFILSLYSFNSRAQYLNAIFAARSIQCAHSVQREREYGYTFFRKEIILLSNYHPGIFGINPDWNSSADASLCSKGGRRLVT